MVHEACCIGCSLSPFASPSTVRIVCAVRLHREHQARAHRRAVDDHRAGAADAMLAADMRAGLAAILADRVGQRLARLDADGVVAAIDGEGNVASSRSCGLLSLRIAARMRCGVAGHLVDLDAER